MAIGTQRLLTVAILATALGAVVWADGLPEPAVEFDGRAHQNPRGHAGGKITVTGVARPPAGATVEGIDVERQSSTAMNKGAWTSVKAQADTTKSPVRWSAQFDRCEPGEYWVQARLVFVTADGTRMVSDSHDRRRVYVPGTN